MVSASSFAQLWAVPSRDSCRLSCFSRCRGGPCVPVASLTPSALSVCRPEFNRSDINLLFIYRASGLANRLCKSLTARRYAKRAQGALGRLIGVGPARSASSAEGSQKMFKNRSRPTISVASPVVDRPLR